MEILLAEGDPDAQVINQFEESLIDTLQSDPEIATCLNTYLEARRKISEKVKGRGVLGSKRGPKEKDVARTRVDSNRSLGNLWLRES